MSTARLRSPRLLPSYLRRSLLEVTQISTYVEAARAGAMVGEIPDTHHACKRPRATLSPSPVHEVRTARHPKSIGRDVRIRRG